MMAKAADPVTFSPSRSPATTTSAATIAQRDNAPIEIHPKKGVDPAGGLLPPAHSDCGRSRLARGSAPPAVSKEPQNTTRTGDKKSHVTAFQHPSDEPFVGERQRDYQGVGRHTSNGGEETHVDEGILGEPAAVDEDLEAKGAPWHRGKANNFAVQDPGVQVPRTHNSGWVNIEEDGQVIALLTDCGSV